MPAPEYQVNLDLLNNAFKSGLRFQAEAPDVTTFPYEDDNVARLREAFKLTKVFDNAARRFRTD